MNRRESIGALLVLGGAGAFGAAAQTKVARIGFLATTNPEGTPHLAAFREGMRSRGWVEGKNLAIEFRWVESSFAHRPELIEELVRLKVDLIFAWSSPAVAAARKATSAIPIVFAAVGDPVGAGFVESLARPGGNVTGVSNIVRDITAKQVQFLSQAVPGMRRVAILRNPDNPITGLLLKEAQEAARALGLQYQVFEVRSGTDFEGAFAGMQQAGSAGLVILGDPMVFGERRRIAGLALMHRLPSTFIASPYPDAGGLMSFGFNVQDQFRRAADYVDRILKGAKPADLPVEQPTTVELVVNLKTAKALGIKIPQAILSRADRVIE